MTKHTAGPWHRNIRANGKYPTVFAGRNRHVAVVTQQDDPEETEANIDLIAAAPEMRRILEDALLHLGVGWRAAIPKDEAFKLPTWVHEARRVVRKARGR